MVNKTRVSCLRVGMTHAADFQSLSVELLELGTYAVSDTEIAEHKTISVPHDSRQAVPGTAAPARDESNARPATHSHLQQRSEPLSGRGLLPAAGG